MLLGRATRKLPCVEKDVLTYSWNKELFPDHVKFMADLHDRDLKITLNTHPGDGIRPFEESYERVCKALNRDPAVGDVSIPT